MRLCVNLKHNHNEFYISPVNLIRLVERKHSVTSIAVGPSVAGLARPSTRSRPLFKVIARTLRKVKR